MELILSREKTGNFNVAGHNGGGVKCKERVGQSSNSLSSEYRISLPDKVNAAWYIALTDKVKGLRLVSFKDNIKVIDTSPNLQAGYAKLHKLNGMDYSVLKLKVNNKRFVNELGKAIMNLKVLANKSNKY